MISKIESNPQQNLYQSTLEEDKILERRGVPIINHELRSTNPWENGDIDTRHSENTILSMFNKFSIDESMMWYKILSAQINDDLQKIISKNQEQDNSSFSNFNIVKDLKDADQNYRNSDYQRLSDIFDKNYDLDNKRHKNNINRYDHDAKIKRKRAKDDARVSMWDSIRRQFDTL